jgi:hypothetical protein
MNLSDFKISVNLLKKKKKKEMKISFLSYLSPLMALIFLSLHARR